MIFFDITQSHNSRHHSGLVRVSRCLYESIGGRTQVVPVAWRDGGWELASTTEGGLFAELKRRLRLGGRVQKIQPGADDWLLFPDLFSEAERPGLRAFLRSRACHAAAVFHDAIPLRLPEISMRKSVSRHPDYMALLAEMDCILAVSESSRRELLGFWAWAGRGGVPPVRVVTWGADFSGSRVTDTSERLAPPSLICVGIMEPRKNQAFLLDVCARLWDDGLNFALHLAGRINKEHGASVRAKVEAMAKDYPGLDFHENADDAELLALYGQTRAAVFPTKAEGFGLPVLEALWAGLPCVCSDLPVLREQATGGGCVLAAVDDVEAWDAVLRRMITDDVWARWQRDQARMHPLPQWQDTAAQVLAHLGIATGEAIG